MCCAAISLFQCLDLANACVQAEQLIARARPAASTTDRDILQQSGNTDNQNQKPCPHACRRIHAAIAEAERDLPRLART